ncbi:MAG: aspartate racemase [Proteobacteria bacterium]|nr:MAG: aspartate racemase [Pseudomonadota bacterium]
MKTIGLLGGMSWESTALYYELINEDVKESLGGLHSAKIVMVSVDFGEIERLQKSGDWDKAGEVLGKACKDIQNAGADFILICTNTMHKVVPDIEKHITIPILHIADATAKVLKEDDIKRVGLLGTAFTMGDDFYKNRLIEKFGIEVITPSSEDMKILHDVIFKELCLGKRKEISKKEYLRIVKDLQEQGAQGVILGCTEIGMLINQNDTDVKLYDTTLIHAKEGARFALAKI